MSTSFRSPYRLADCATLATEVKDAVWRPQRSVVIERGDAPLNRDVLRLVEEVEDRLPRRSLTPGGQRVRAGHTYARTMQRKPMWLMPVSIICGRRAAGLYLWQ